MTKTIKVPYFCFHHGNGVYSGVVFYDVIGIVKLMWLDGDTYFTRIAWDTIPRKIKVRNILKSNAIRRTPRLK